MKVEKINNNKAMIVMTLEELANREITLKDIKEGAENVQDFFFEILQDTDIAHEFTQDTSNLFVEVTTTGEDIFMITITKADCIPDITNYEKISKQNKVLYTVSSNLYLFSNLNTLYEFCKKAAQENLYIGVNSLYEFNNKYFLLFSNSTIKKSNFVRTFGVISEYADKYYSKQLEDFLEYATPLFYKHAIQELQKI